MDCDFLNFAFSLGHLHAQIYAKDQGAGEPNDPVHLPAA